MALQLTLQKKYLNKKGEIYYTSYDYSSDYTNIWWDNITLDFGEEITEESDEPEWKSKYEELLNLYREAQKINFDMDFMQRNSLSDIISINKF